MMDDEDCDKIAELLAIMLSRVAALRICDDRNRDALLDDLHDSIKKAQRITGIEYRG